MKEYTYWPRNRPTPSAGDPVDAFTTHEDADEALSSHVAMNPSLSLDKGAYVILSREVGEWGE